MLSLAVVVVYASLPHYSTDRFWYAAAQANLSMTLYFFSSYCDLRELRSRGVRALAWKAGAVLALFASTLAYEVFMPLFLLNPVLLAFYRKRLQQRDGTQYSGVRAAVSWILNPAALGIVVLFKTRSAKLAGVVR